MLPTGKCALVTGASSGIGAEVAAQLASRGAYVLVHGRDPDRTREVADRIGGAAVAADLADPGGRQQLVEQVREVCGAVDILVNNAGVGWAGPLTDMPVERIRHIVEVNLLAPMELTRMLLPDMIRRVQTHICFVTSVAGRTGVAGEAAYAATKAGVDAFAESLRAEAAGTGLRVGVVVPGVVDTAFFAARGRPYDRERPRPIPADAVARAVVRQIETGRAEAWAPRWLRVAPTVRALAPSAYRRLTDRFGQSIRLGDAEARKVPP
ncbi:SDR family NAD(P)-dependent oxidoreductase [Skermania sp. ID1734]|uniref:SDR family NAD(P)-dependent oxidoreductase n=1 Tax=Skermania sp. ID1734 TaxID=2597516 RepID=UPI00117FCA2E|nr:SDR family NAD(P)-dependent oxidoreductase [Skermania sp. ID1734]TSE00322.1 SDR family NAD(P)-dependent oxidoreductase [Skermania sp. ID1734]